jgi:hypothetical protein
VRKKDLKVGMRVAHRRGTQYGNITEVYVVAIGGFAQVKRRFKADEIRVDKNISSHLKTTRGVGVAYCTGGEGLERKWYPKVVRLAALKGEYDSYMQERKEQRERERAEFEAEMLQEAANSERNEARWKVLEKALDAIDDGVYYGYDGMDSADFTVHMPARVLEKLVYRGKYVARVIRKDGNATGFLWLEDKEDCICRAQAYLDQLPSDHDIEFDRLEVWLFGAVIYTARIEGTTVVKEEVE